MYRVIYQSRATLPLAPEALARLVERAQRNNGRGGVSGLLIEFAGRYLQVIEGPRGEVLHTLARIERDPRHHDLTVLFAGEAARRAFPGLRLGYARPEALPVELRESALTLSELVRPEGLGASDAALAGLIRRFLAQAEGMARGPGQGMVPAPA